MSALLLYPITLAQMKTKSFLLAMLLSVLLPQLSGCGTTYRTTSQLQLATHLSAEPPPMRQHRLSREMEDRILALNPSHITAQEVSEVLSNAPTPHILNIHGAVFPVYLCMVSFSEFLIGMGYPDASLTNAATGDYSFSPYDDSAKIAGAVAWYYEREGLRPMIIGHSLGGIQTVKVLYKLDDSSSPLLVWNPLTAKFENRTNITDPLSGQLTPVNSLKVSYAAAIATGGFGRLFPNQWGMIFRLRAIPNSVIEFSGYQVPFDIMGGDLLCLTPLDDYASIGTAQVHNLQLSLVESHALAPATSFLIGKPELVEWINNYSPEAPQEAKPKISGNLPHLLFAADIWYHVKKHWVLELQRQIRARRGDQPNDT